MFDLILRQALPVLAIASALSLVQAHAATATHWGPHGVTTVHTPGPCCYHPYGYKAGAVAAGAAVGAALGAAAAHPPYAYAYPTYYAYQPRAVVYPAPVVVVHPPVYVYPARPLP